MPLSAPGFEPENEADILDGLIALATSLMGADIDTGETSIMGSFLRIIANKFALYQQDIEAIFLAWFYDSAEGVQLDRVAANVGLTRNMSQPAYVSLNFTGKAGTVIGEDSLFETEDGQTFSMEDVVMLDDDGNGSGTAVSLEENDNANVPAESITVQTNPIEDITSVINPEMASGGAEDEDDETFRKRIRIWETSSSGGTKDGIKAALANVVGVTQTEVNANTENVTDADGNPPHSIHVYVDGGTDEDIATTLISTVAAGTPYVGKTVVDGIDAGGNSQEIRFDRPTGVPIFINIDLETDADFETDGPDEIKENIQDYLNGLSMGAKVRTNYLYTLVFLVGVVDATITIGRSTDALGEADVQLSTFETASYAAGNVVINGAS